jgi:hypothetical protein
MVQILDNRAASRRTNCLITRLKSKRQESDGENLQTVISSLMSGLKGYSGDTGGEF